MPTEDLYRSQGAGYFLGTPPITGGRQRTPYVSPRAAVDFQFVLIGLAVFGLLAYWKK